LDYCGGMTRGGAVMIERSAQNQGLIVEFR
jgi:hypothetical protein